MHTFYLKLIIRAPMVNCTKCKILRIFNFKLPFLPFNTCFALGSMMAPIVAIIPV